MRRRRVGQFRRARERVRDARRRLIAMRRRHADDLAVITAAVTRNLLLNSLRQRRMVWVRPKNRNFFHEIVPGWEDEEWKCNFRVGRPTFNFLCSQLQPAFQKREVVRKPLSVEEKVAITLWRLGTNVEYRSLAHLWSWFVNSLCNSARSVQCYCN